jgi:DNA-directed RNA polymerase omega subunit
MLIDPPIDKLIKKAECRYEMVCAVSKRAREIINHEREMTEESREKAITQSCKEIYDNKVIIVRD